MSKFSGIEKKIIAPYGTWESPISARSVGSGNHVFELALYNDDLYFVEVRPLEEMARYSVMKLNLNAMITHELTPPPFNARTTVHEYGGGGFLVARNQLIFSNFSDQRLYKINVDSTERPSPLTREGRDVRFGDGIFDEKRNQMICVRELHPRPGEREAINSVVAIDISSGNETVIVSGNDFYAYPRISRDSSKLAWITWNFPNMPFDGSELWIADLDSSGKLQNNRKLAGGLDESVTQPKWSESGDLFFISDRSGWWNLYRWTNENGISTISLKEADFCHPDWNLGLSTYSFESENRIICTFAVGGEWRLGSIDTSSSKLETIDSPFTEINHINALTSQYAVFLAGSPKEGHKIFKYDFSLKKIQEIYDSPGEESEEETETSLPFPITFPTTNNLKAYAFFYEPTNSKYEGSKQELPPLIVMVHGGPTHASSSLNRGTIQFFTSRGFAVLDVNYGGSSAYGREYRRRLNGQWGVVDVDDCVNGALYLAKEGKIDSDRVVIRGGSAGGWTTLCGLTFRDFFKAGACYYGISDLERWELDCHKFESQYLHSLIGSYPQERELFLDRSPTTHADRVSRPLIIFQGKEDKVVPPNQSELMVEALRKRNKPVEYFAFDGEQHDFRQAKRIEEALNRELDHFRKALKIRQQ